MSPRDALSNALECVLDAKRELNDAKKEHDVAVDRLRDATPDGEVLVGVYVRGIGFCHFIVTKGEDGGVGFRSIAELSSTAEPNVEAKP